MELPRPSRKSVVLLASACVALAACTAGPRGPVDAPGAVTYTRLEAPTMPLSGTSFREATERGRAQLVFAYVPAAGFAYLDDAGRPTGVTVELLRDFADWVAQAHGVAVDVSWYEQPSWSTFYGEVRDAADGVLGVGNVTITAERRRELGFSPPYMSNIATLVTHESVPELDAMTRIASRFTTLTGLVFPGTLHASRLDAIRHEGFERMATRPVESNEEMVALLAADDGYFGYLDIYNFWRAQEAGLPLRRHPVGDDASETFGVILPEGSDWTPIIAGFFESGGGYVGGPRFRAHLERHLGTGLAELLREP